jgi:propionyl-CoA carboxylase alpha chain
MGEQAVALAKAVNYQSAGTVEFVVGKDKRFYFLEMNTRLQVEHPVTECITGLDLVAQMIRVAAGEPLAFTQDQVQRKGWAIECRINAEDPLRSFLPSTGRLVAFEPPEQTLVASGGASPAFGGGEGEQTGGGGRPPSRPSPRGGRSEVTGVAGGIRVDTGVYEGGEIPMFYDSMICKLIAYGTDRLDAIAKMRDALDAFVIQGISSNIPFQAALLAHPKFVAGDFNTGFIAENYPKGFTRASVIPDDPNFLLALAVATNRRVLVRSAGISGQLPGHELQVGEHFIVVQTDADGTRHETPASVRLAGDVYDVEVGGRSYPIRFTRPLRDTAMHGDLAGKPFCAQVERLMLAYRVTHHGAQAEVRVLSPRAAELNALMPFKAPPDLSKFLLSPMPGLLVDVAVTAGQAVRAGEKLAVIEAMKMENILIAAHDGVVSQVKAAQGESLSVDQVIMEFR